MNKYIVKLCCLLIPKKKNRKHFRKKHYKKSNIIAGMLENIRAEFNEKLNIIAKKQQDLDIKLYRIVYLVENSLDLKPDKVFTDIFKNKRWNCRESVSGSGSDLRNTETLRKELPVFLRNSI